MPGAKGNQNNKKWKTPKERQEAFEAVCQHLAAGYSKESFPLADWDTVEAYCKEFPIDFPPEKLKEAMRRQQAGWEKIGMDGARGEIEGFNATSWIFNMKNRFNWRDKQDHDINHGLQDSLKEVLQQIDGRSKGLPGGE